MADHDSEKFLKNLMGRSDIEDSLLLLDLFTKEESLEVLKTTLVIGHRIDGNVEAIKVRIERIEDELQRSLLTADTVIDCQS
jgi:hypothetical protein